MILGEGIASFRLEGNWQLEDWYKRLKINDCYATEKEVVRISICSIFRQASAEHRPPSGERSDAAKVFTVLVINKMGGITQVCFGLPLEELELPIWTCPDTERSRAPICRNHLACKRIGRNEASMVIEV